MSLAEIPLYSAMLAFFKTVTVKASRLTKSQRHTLTAMAVVFIMSLTLSWHFFYKRGHTVPLDLLPVNVQSAPYTAAIIYLASARRVSELIPSLTLVAMNLRTAPWPIILFHTGDFDHVEARSDLLGLLAESLIDVANMSSPMHLSFVIRIQFTKLHWSLPAGIPNNVTLVDPVDSPVWPGRQ